MSCERPRCTFILAIGNHPSMESPPPPGRGPMSPLAADADERRVALPLRARKARLALVGTVSAALMWVIWPYIGAIFWSVVLAIVFAPLHAWILGLSGGRRLVAGLMTLLVIVVGVVVPLALLASALFRQAGALYADIAAGRIDVGGYLQRITDALPAWARQALDGSGIGELYWIREKLSTSAVEASRFVATQLLGFGLNAFSFALSLAIMLYLLYVLLSDGRSLAARIERFSPLPADETRSLATTFSTVVRATVKGGVVMAATQGLLGGVVLGLLGIEATLFWGVVFGLLSMIPAVGAGLLWAPIALYFLATGAVVKGIVLIVFGTVVLTVIDNVLRPLMVGRDTQLPGYMVLVATLGGVHRSASTASSSGRWLPPCSWPPGSCSNRSRRREGRSDAVPVAGNTECPGHRRPTAHKGFPKADRRPRSSARDSPRRLGVTTAIVDLCSIASSSGAGVNPRRLRMPLHASPSVAKIQRIPPRIPGRRGLNERPSTSASSSPPPSAMPCSPATTGRRCVQGLRLPDQPLRARERPDRARGNRRSRRRAGACSRRLAVPKAYLILAPVRPGRTWREKYSPSRARSARALQAGARDGIRRRAAEDDLGKVRRVQLRKQEEERQARKERLPQEFFEDDSPTSRVPSRIGLPREAVVHHQPPDTRQSPRTGSQSGVTSKVAAAHLAVDPEIETARARGCGYQPEDAASAQMPCARSLERAAKRCSSPWPSRFRSTTQPPCRRSCWQWRSLTRLQGLHQCHRGASFISCDTT